MLWKELSLTCLQVHLSTLENFLIEEGACSISYQDAKDQPILEPKVGENPLWDEVVLVALFTEKYDHNKVTIKLNQSRLKLFIIGEIKVREFADQDWTRAWMNDFQPMQFGQKLWIYPSWFVPPSHDPNQINVLLDPGLAFGTGTHQTTALCLNWLDREIKGGESVIDFGTGSGILGIAARKLGAKSVIAIDNDPQAIIASKANADKNTIVVGFSPCLPQDVPMPLAADILIANILAGILIELAATIASYVKMGGKLALSGILQEQVDEVSEIFSQYFTLSKPVFKDEWALICGIRK
ncbi:50S ribosomal protein L11 methyltransferase [Fastidiosibacter lacustris]|uniref:50S ribosomal protein L11 methyltransferase n=1 Tax=Fastidiosibacter lacustris TaxID=2056695 RepID=UPI000E34B4C8|nr:50S ribosomal protein L11 methyltransferase [Fastidiosibacter lacustris]